MWNSNTSAEQIHNLFKKELRMFLQDHRLAITSPRNTINEWLDNMISNINNLATYQGNHPDNYDCALAECLGGFYDFPDYNFEEEMRKSCKRIAMMKELIEAYHILKPSEISNGYKEKFVQIIQLLQYNRLWFL
jgi:hypothetical protein